MTKRIMFTGGSGKAGRHVVQYLVEHGCQVLNIDTKPLDNPKVRTLITDITDSGQVFNALSSYMGLHEFDPSLRPQPVDAVVHFAAIPRIMITPDNELFRINALGTYNVIEAAVKLGIRKIVIASSETTYGWCSPTSRATPKYFPLDEDYDVDPMDSYALSKVVNEQTARAFALRSGTDIYALRIGNVIEPHEYALFPKWFADPGFRKRIAWSYIDARDLGQITDLPRSRRTGSATRCSTPPMTTPRPTCRPPSCCSASTPTCRSRRTRRIRDAAFQPQGARRARLPPRT